MITDRIGLHSVQLPLLIITIPISEKKKQQQQIHLRKTSPVVKMSNKKFGNFPVFFLRVSGCCHGYCGQFCDWWI